MFIQDSESRIMRQVPLRVVCLAADEPKGDPPTRAEEDSTRRDRPTHQVVRRTTYEVVHGHKTATSADTLAACTAASSARTGSWSLRNAATISSARWSRLRCRPALRSS